MESFDQLAEQYTPMIHNIIHTLHIYKNKDEYFETGLVALWEASLHFNEEKGNFTSYAYSTIKGKILIELTKMKKHEDRSYYPEEVYWNAIEAEDVIRLPDEDYVRSFCKNLSVKETKWLLYTCINDYSIRDIAQREHVTVSAVKQWRTSARGKLRREVILEMME